MNKRVERKMLSSILYTAYTIQVQQASLSLIHIFLTLQFSVMCAT